MSTNRIIISQNFEVTESLSCDVGSLYTTKAMETPIKKEQKGT
jgi:hypothetical protein